MIVFFSFHRFHKLLKKPFSGTHFSLSSRHYTKIYSDPTTMFNTGERQRDRKKELRIENGQFATKKRIGVQRL